MEWTSVNQSKDDGLCHNLKIRGSLITVWADEEESQEESSLKHGCSPMTRPRRGGKAPNGWLARSHFLVRQETEDLYCDDELHPSLENDPNMQLSIAQQAAAADQHVKPYPPMPMLTDRGNFFMSFFVIWFEPNLEENLHNVIKLRYGGHFFRFWALRILSLLVPTLGPL